MVMSKLILLPVPYNEREFHSPQDTHNAGEVKAAACGVAANVGHG